MSSHSRSIGHYLCQTCRRVRPSWRPLPAATWNAPLRVNRVDNTPQHRPYAVARTKRNLPSSSKIWRMDGFTISSFENVIAGAGGSFRAMTPEQYYESAQRFFGAVQNASDPWSIVYSDKHGVSSDVLYEAGLILRWIREPPNGGALAHAMWASAAAMGHLPSILTLTRDLIRSGNYGKVAGLARVEARFKKLVSQGKNPDALTLEGELLFRQAKYVPAVAALQRAVQIDSAGFDWKPYCQLYLAKAKLKLGNVAEAQDMLHALSESGFVEADAELGNMLKASDPGKAEQHLFTAAQNGRLEVFNQLSQMAMERAESAVDAKSRDEFRRWALEWSKLADRGVEY